MRRIPEVRREHSLRPLATRSDRRDAQTGRVRRENRRRPGGGIQPGEELLFELHVLGRRFDYQVGPAHRSFEIARRLEDLQRVGDSLRRYKLVIQQNARLIRERGPIPP